MRGASRRFGRRAKARILKIEYPYPHEPEDLQMLPHLPKGFEYDLAFRFAPPGKNPPCGDPARERPYSLNFTPRGGGLGFQLPSPLLHLSAYPFM